MDNDKLKEGRELLAADKNAEAFQILLPLAQQGIAEAESNIGFMYFVGQGVKRDLGEAVKWLKDAAEKGRGEATHNLGTLYLTCEPNMPRNEKKSKEWYQRAKELGFQVSSDDWCND